MHQPFARTVRLGMPGAASGEAYVTPEGFFLGDGSALVTVDLAKNGSSRAKVRSEIEIALLLEAAYGECPDAAALSNGLGAVARALDAGDLPRAAIAAVHLRLPPIADAATLRRLAEANRLLKGGFDPNEPRDGRGRWTTGTTAPVIQTSSTGPGFWDRFNFIGTAEASESDQPSDPAYEARRRAGQTSEIEDAEHGNVHIEQIKPGLAPGSAGPFVGGGLAAASAPNPISPPPATAAAPYSEGSFSISDWSGYPEGVPRPDGPFRILEGSEYTEARDAADNANRKLHRADPSLEGQDIHDVHPIKLGGDPVDPANKIPMAPSEHRPFTTWWATLQRLLQ
jgi:hypothetical protein